MKCNEILERMPELAAGFSLPTADEGNHIETCGACAEEWKTRRAAVLETMALLDEWQVPEPSPYFDVRLQARLREEMAKPQSGWLRWFRQPVLAAALTVIMGVGVGLYFAKGYQHGPVEANINVTEAPGSAVSDLQSLENNHDLYSDFETLDDLDLQRDVAANP